MTDADQNQSHQAKYCRHRTSILFCAIYDTWKYRNLTWTLFLRDLKSSYRQSFLGFAWLILPIALQTAIWTFLTNNNLLRTSPTSIPYTMHVLLGLLIWNFLVACICSPIASFSSGKAVFSKIKVPPESFILAGILRACLDMLIRLLVMLPIFYLFPVKLTALAFLFPIVMLFICICGVGLGLLLIPIGALYSDVQKLVNAGLPLAMYTIPIIYPPPKDGIASTLVNANPATPLIMFARDTLTLGDTAYIISFATTSLIGTLFFIAGVVLFRIATPILIERMGM